ncbi:MAG: endonuclease [Bacteroidia bacterium]
MKNSFLITALIAFAFSVSAQSPVPTSWDCSDGNPPAGWTFDNISGGNTNYSAAASCDGVSSLRLDADGENLTIFFGQQPGEITFQIGGSTTGSPWEGTFTVDESVDGSTWVNILTYNDGELPVGSTPCLEETITLSNLASRYVRFFYEDKVSGSNLKVDEISIAAANIAEATISVLDTELGNPVLANTIAPPFNTTTRTFTVRNEGTEGTLTVTDISFGGQDAASFANASTIFPFDVLPGESADVTLDFTPIDGPGSYTALATISSNDANNLEYSFQIYAIDGDFATEPSTGITNLPASINKSYRTIIGVSGTGVIADDILGGYVLLRSIGAAVSTAPSDGQTYARGMSIGNAKVMFAGRPAGDLFSVNARYVEAGTEYHFAIFPYYGSGVFTNYLNTINDNIVNSPETMISATEYDAISTDAPTFVEDLKAVINPHTSIFYSNYTNTMVNLFLARDTFATVGPNSFSRVINCVYSGETRLFNDPFDWSALGYSREHTFPHSWMPSFPADNPEQPEYNDQHNLYPARQSNVNDLRCNYPLGEVNIVETEFLEGKLGLDIDGNRVYEPQDSHKGRAARALMYMATCYNNGNATFNFEQPSGLTCSGVAINYGQDQNLIKKWHFTYPPDNFDHSRNDFLDSLQTNRNPFVDEVDYACYIDFSNMTKIETPANPCYTTSVKDIENMHLLAYPNPNNGNFRLSFKGTGEALTLNISDLSGKIVKSQNIASSSEVIVIDFAQNDLPSGMYLVNVIGNRGFASSPIIITN